MKLKQFSLSLRVSVLTTVLIESLTLFSSPAYANQYQYSCGRYEGKLITYVIKSKTSKPKPLIRWINSQDFPPPWSPVKRCFEVAKRFQKNYDHGTLEVINSGLLKGETVICGGVKPSDACTDATLLFTLRRGADPDKVIQQLMDRRGRANGYIMNQTGPGSIDFGKYLENIPEIPGEIESIPEPKE